MGVVTRPPVRSIRLAAHMLPEMPRGATTSSPNPVAAARANRLTLGVERAVLAEAQIVAPRINDVERALAPRARDHRAGRFAVDLIRGEHAELIGTRLHAVNVVDGEVERPLSGRRSHA